LVLVEPKRIKRAFYTCLILAGVFLGLSGLILLGQTAQNSEEFGRLHNSLLMINAAAALVLLMMIVGNLIRLLRDYRRGTPGARLKARMLAAFVGLAIAPLLIVYFFAVQFLNEGIDTWFDPEMEQGLADALALSRSALDVRMTKDLESTHDLAARLAEMRAEGLVTRLGELRREVGALELTIFGDGNRILATTSQNLSTRLPILPPDDIALQVQQSDSYIGLEPATEGAYWVRAVVLVPKIRLGEETRILQALFPVASRQGALADSVESTYSRYGELLFLREPLKSSFTITLTLVVMLSFLAAVYGAFFFARRLVAPIQLLVDGTRSVAEGDLDTRLPTATHDEIGFLIDSFNLMIQRLAEAREEARLSAQQVESERAQLQAILSRLSTGVIAVDAGGRLRRVNEAAGQILAVDLAARMGERLTDIAIDNPLLEQFMMAFDSHHRSEATEWREQLTLKTESGRRVLVCACTELPVEGEKIGGNVIVFDDVTTLLQAQRDAAWGEVARRLAHEIKNPLTPIQLSAERIRRKYLGNMEEMEAQVLDRATHTIVQQVEAMRDMVNAFSEYARAPEITISRFEINQLIREVAYLYRTRDNHPAVELKLDERLSEVEADTVRVRQLLHNLIRNAMEAMEGQDDAHVKIETRPVEEAGREMAEIRVSDNGPGIDPETLEQIFEPYVTTKTKGTGLGLAIVKKLVDEHGGTVSAESLEDGGACISVRLPVKETNSDGMTESRSTQADTRRERA
jgi:nitrogen fixation/metabolism regulation signal transduction histidine kinase